MGRIHVVGLCALWVLMLTVLPAPLALKGTFTSSQVLDGGILLAVSIIAWLMTLWAAVVGLIFVLSLPAAGDRYGARTPTRIITPLSRLAARMLPRIAPRMARQVLFAAFGVGTLASAVACGGPTELPVDQPANPIAVQAVSLDQWNPDWPQSAGSEAPVVTVDWPVSSAVEGANGPTGPADSAGLGVDVLPKASVKDHAVDSPVSEKVVDIADTAGNSVEQPAEDINPQPKSVVVAGGDSLWTIAADQLGPRASVAEIDAEWQRWYAANKQVIGDNPDVIQPGLHLVVPERSQS